MSARGGRRPGAPAGVGRGPAHGRGAGATVVDLVVCISLKCARCACVEELILDIIKAVEPPTAVDTATLCHTRQASNRGARKT